MSERVELGRIIDSYTKVVDGGKRILDGDPSELESEVASLLPLLGEAASNEQARALLNDFTGFENGLNQKLYEKLGSKYGLRGHGFHAQLCDMINEIRSNWLTEREAKKVAVSS